MNKYNIEIAKNYFFISRLWILLQSTYPVNDFIPISILEDAINHRVNPMADGADDSEKNIFFQV